MTSQNPHETKSNAYTVGTKVKLLIDNMDNDENGLERKIAANTVGTITYVDYSSVIGFYYHVEFENGGWLDILNRRSRCVRVKFSCGELGAFDSPVDLGLELLEAAL